MSQSTIYEKTIDTEEPYQFIVGVYEDEEVGKYLRIMKVIWAKAWIETNLELLQQSEVLSAISEAIAKITEVTNDPLV